jgi:hypothetical protein
VHAPAWHVSVCVHALPSLHAVPFAFAGFEQTPVAVLHVPARWHWSGAEHVTGFAPVHAPAWHVSVCVHALPSLHAVPFGFAGFEQSPVVVSQAATWHWSLALHTTGFVPVHTPAWHVSVCVHALPSSHAVPVNGVHVPSALPPAAVEHASHTPALHAVSQHTPSAQKPLEHSAPLPHATPFALAGTNTYTAPRPDCSPGAPATAVSPLTKTAEPMSPSAPTSFCCCDHALPDHTNTYAARFTCAPTIAVSPLTETEYPKRSLITRSLAVSFACSDHADPERTKTYAAPRPWSFRCTPMTAVSPLTDTEQPYSSDDCPPLAISWACSDHVVPDRTKAYAVP